MQSSVRGRQSQDADSSWNVGHRAVDRTRALALSSAHVTSAITGLRCQIGLDASGPHDDVWQSHCRYARSDPHRMTIGPCFFFRRSSILFRGIS